MSTEVQHKNANTRAPSSASTGPERGGIILTSLILVAAVANLNLSVANVALPTIGRAFNASQTSLDLVAVGYSLGLAASVLWLGTLGDRYGRKMMLITGTALAIPASLLAAFAPSVEVLIVARLLGGLAAGMAYPTTLALITALWSGPGRTRSIALWSGLGGAIASFGPLIAGFLLQYFSWGSVFLATLPLAVVALVMALLLVPSHVNETTNPVDNLGGILSALLIGALILLINEAAVPNEGALVLGVAVIAVAAGMAFFIRQRRAKSPLFDLHIAGRRTFWVAACAGIIVFGSFMGAVFIAQQFLQNVLGYSTLEAGLSVLPLGACMVLITPLSAKLVEARGARLTLLTGYVFCGRRAAHTGRSASLTPSSGPASGLQARLPRTHSPVPCPSNAPAWRRGRRTSSVTWAARSCSRSSVRCSPPATPRPLLQPSPRLPTGSRSRAASRRRSRSRSAARPTSRSSIRSTRAKSRPRRRLRSWQATSGFTSPGSW